MRDRYIITFAGVPGSSKSIVAHHLSLCFGLPIMSTDNIRYEVKEDLKVKSINEPEALKEYERRRQELWQQLLEGGKPFILDGSVDRKWESIKSDLLKATYDWCLIDMEFSKGFMQDLYAKTDRVGSIDELDVYMDQHQQFLSSHAGDLAVQITDNDFGQRKQIAQETVSNFLSV